MSTAVEEVVKAVVEDVPAATVKPAKEKKAAKAPKPKSAKITPHPPYFQMIKESLLALNERTGSSPHAIAKFMEEKHKTVLPVNFRKTLGLQLKNFSSKGKLIKIKASYKLSHAGKKVTVVKKPAAVEKKKKPASEQKKSAKPAPAKKTEAAKKLVAKPVKKATTTKKRAAPVATKAKQPKSIKAPAAKKAKKATV